MNYQLFERQMTAFEKVVARECQLKQLHDAVNDVNETAIGIGVNVTFYFSRKDNRYVSGIDASLLNGLLYDFQARVREALEDVKKEKATLRKDLHAVLEED